MGGNALNAILGPVKKIRNILLTLYYYADIVWVEDRERPNPKPRKTR